MRLLVVMVALWVSTVARLVVADTVGADKESYSASKRVAPQQSKEPDANPAGWNHLSPQQKSKGITMETIAPGIWRMPKTLGIRRISTDGARLPHRAAAR